MLTQDLATKNDFALKAKKWPPVLFLPWFYFLTLWNSNTKWPDLSCHLVLGAWFPHARLSLRALFSGSPSFFADLIPDLHAHLCGVLEGLVFIWVFCFCFFFVLSSEVFFFLSLTWKLALIFPFLRAKQGYSLQIAKMCSTNVSWIVLISSPILLLLPQM